MCWSTVFNDGRNCKSEGSIVSQRGTGGGFDLIIIVLGTCSGNEIGRQMIDLSLKFFLNQSSLT